MQLDTDEIDAVSHAIVSLSYYNYTPEQYEYLYQFLRQYAVQEIDEEQVQKLFNDKKEVIQFIQLLHQFSKKTTHQESIVTEFQEELNELIIQLNGHGNSIFI